MEWSYPRINLPLSEKPTFFTKGLDCLKLERIDSLEKRDRHKRPFKKDGPWFNALRIDRSGKKMIVYHRPLKVKDGLTLKSLSIPSPFLHQNKSRSKIEALLIKYVSRAHVSILMFSAAARHG